MSRRFPLCLLLFCLFVLCWAPVAAADEALLVGNKSDDTVWRLSLEDGHKLGETGTGAGPHEIAVNPSATLGVVANYGHDRAGATLTVLDPGSGAVLRTIDLAPHARPHGIRFLPGEPARVLVTTEQSESLLVVDFDAAGAGCDERFRSGAGVATWWPYRATVARLS